MALTPGVRRVIQTRSGHYTAEVIPLEKSEIAGFDATFIRAVRDDDPARSVRLVLYRRAWPRLGLDVTHAA